MTRCTRRDALKALGAAGALGSVLPATAQAPASPIDAAIARSDAAVRGLLQTQVTDPASPFRGSVPDGVGLHSAGSASSVAELMAAAVVHPRSAFVGDRILVERIRLAAGFLERVAESSGQHRSADDQLQLAS